MRDINEIILVGRLTKDPEIKMTPNNFKSARFTLASSDDYKKNGDTVKRTNFINCEAYGATAEILEKYAGKGKQVAIVGKMYVREGQKDGQKTWYSGITVQTIQLLASSSGSGDSEGHAPRKENGRTAPKKVPEDFDEFPLDFNEMGGAEGPGDVQIPF